jgi:hypothetical protein
MNPIITTALISAGIPCITTLITSILQYKISMQHSAKSSILQMIMEDEFAWEIFKKFPVNYGNICDEYTIYHKNGGNGEVTRKVNDYKNWYDSIETSQINKK